MAEAAATDAALIEAAQNGDVASYGKLVERYQAVAHRTAFALGAGDDTADVVQEAFVKAFLALGRFRVSEPFRPWLLKIVVNEARNRWRWTLGTAQWPCVGRGRAVSPDQTPEQVAEEHTTARTTCRGRSADPSATLSPVVPARLTETETAQVLRFREAGQFTAIQGLAALQGYSAGDRASDHESGATPV